MTLDYLDLDIPVGSKICLYNATMKSVPEFALIVL